MASAVADINPRALPRQDGDEPFATPDGGMGSAVTDPNREFDVVTGLWDGEFALGRAGVASAAAEIWSKDRSRARLYKLMYWRKPDLPDGTWGDITINSNYPSDFMANIETGWTPLPQFGKFDHDNPVTPWGGHWSTRTAPFRLFLAHPKAYSVISLRQALELGWHRAPTPNDRRPDLRNKDGWRELFARWTGEDFECPTCKRKVLSEWDLERHIQVVHTSRAEVDALARTILKASENSQGPMADALRGISEGLAGALAKLDQRQAQSDALLVEFMRMNMQSKPPEDGPGVVLPVGGPVAIPDQPQPERPVVPEITTVPSAAQPPPSARGPKAPAAKPNPKPRQRGKRK